MTEKGLFLSLSTSVSVPPLSILTDTSFDAFHWLLQKSFFPHCSPVFKGCTLYWTRKIKDYQQFTTKNQQGKCSMRSFNFKMVLNNVSQLKHSINKIHTLLHTQYIAYMCTIQNSGISSFVVNLVTWLLCHQLKMHEGCWHSKTFFTFSFKKQQISLWCGR